MTAPLAGVRVVEVASIGPGPFCAMVLADLGADVVRIERISNAAPRSDPPPDPLLRGRTASIAVDLKQDDGVEVALRLVDRADVLVEGFRPGVMERLGLGPDVCRHRNPPLIYGRATGWGQSGPRAGTAGHDIDFVAVAGALHPIGPADRPPPPPLNLVGDFGGGGMLLALGVCAALVARRPDGEVIDAAMVDGAGLLTSMFHGLRTTGAWSDTREANLLDGAAPFYRAYRTADGRFMAVGAIEPKFYRELVAGLGLDADRLPGQYDRSAWPRLVAEFEQAFATRTRDEWVERFAGSDACVVPVNDLDEAARDPHLVARDTFVKVAGMAQPAPAPRFRNGLLATPAPPRPPGADTDRILHGLGYATGAVHDLRRRSVVA